MVYEMLPLESKRRNQKHKIKHRKAEEEANDEFKRLIFYFFFLLFCLILCICSIKYCCFVAGFPYCVNKIFFEDILSSNVTVAFLL